MKTWGFLAVAFALFAACTPAARGEAQSLVSAVDRFRRADFPAKPGLVQGIVDVKCTDSEVCAARDACVAHAEATAKGIVLKNDVNVEMNAADASTLTVEKRAELLGKLDEASELLKKGRELQTACDEKTIALKMKYGG